MSEVPSAENVAGLSDAELAALSLARVLALAEEWAAEEGDPSDPRVKYRRECARLVTAAIEHPTRAIPPADGAPATEDGA